MTKERIVKELSKVREQLAGLQARERDLAEQLQMAEDAEKMKFIEKNKISLDRLILLNKVSEEEIKAEMEQLAAMHGATLKQVEKIVKENGSLAVLVSNIARRKAARLVIDSAKTAPKAEAAEEAKEEK